MLPYVESTTVPGRMQAGGRTYGSVVTEGVVANGVPAWLVITFYVAAGSAAVLTILRLFVKDVIKGAKWFRSVNRHITATNTAIVRMQRDIKRILLFLFPGDPAFEGTSPLRLTDLGRAIADELDADAWVQETVPTLRERVRGEPPDAIEEICFEFIVYGDEFQPDAGLAGKIRASAYQHGIAKEQVRGVLAIALRDELTKLEAADAPVDSG